MIPTVAGVAVILALVAGFFPPQGQGHRPAPHDHVVLHGGDNRWVMLAALMVLAQCAGAVLWLLLGVLWGVLAVLAIATTCIIGLELAGGVRR